MATLVLHEGTVDLKDGIELSMEFVMGCLEERADLEEGPLEIDLRKFTDLVTLNGVLNLEQVLRVGPTKAFMAYSNTSFEGDGGGAGLNLQWISAVNDTLLAASFLQASKAEDEICRMIGTMLRKEFGSGVEARRGLGILEVELTEAEGRAVDELLTRTQNMFLHESDWGPDGLHGNICGYQEGGPAERSQGTVGDSMADPLDVPSSDTLGSRTPDKPASDDSGGLPCLAVLNAMLEFEEHLFGGRRNARDTVHGAICMSSIGRLGSFLKGLNEDLLCKIAAFASTILVPDDCSFEQAFDVVTDYAETGQRIIVRSGRHTLSKPVSVESKVVHVTSADEGCVVASEGSADELFKVMGTEDAGKIRNGVLYARGICFEMPGLSRGKGYWEKGPVLMKVGAHGWSYLQSCNISCPGGAGLVAEGMEPGSHDYLTEGGGDALLPYEERFIVDPRAPKAHALLCDCCITMCTGELGCGCAASSGGSVHLLRCKVRDIGLDGLVSAAGGRLVADHCTITKCGESAVVSSGVSTNKLASGMLERSHSTAICCYVECCEEPLWACESGLLTHSNCILKSTLGADPTKEVTGGIITEYSESL